MTSDHKTIQRYINIAKGQLNGINQMIEDDRYCLDISNQLMATINLLKKANKEILSNHMRHCVKEAQDEKVREEKIEELVKVIEKLS